MGVDEFRLLSSHNFRGHFKDVKEKKRFFSPCTYLWYALSIRYDGVIVPCCLDTEALYPLGKIGEIKIANAWNSEDMQKLRYKMKVNQLKDFSLCSNCDMVKRHKFFGIPRFNILNFLSETILTAKK